MNPNRKPLLFCFPDDLRMAHDLARGVDADIGAIEWRRFPDRESLITLDGACAGRDVVIVCTLNDPDTKALPLYFCAATARDLGARRVGLVAPYLGYMRQDERFRPGQSRSAAGFARLLSSSFDWIVTVDPHLHRIASLAEIFSVRATAVSAMPAVSRWIAANVAKPVIVGPDSESAQWVERVARSLDAPSLVLTKIRRGDRDVTVSAIDPALVRGRNPVILDDIASSGHTLAEALRGFAAIDRQGATCVVVHALLDQAGLAMLRDAGAERVVSTNTITHVTNLIDVVPLLAAEIKTQLARAD